MGEYHSFELQQYLKAHGTIYQNTCSNYDISDINLDSRSNNSQARKDNKKKWIEFEWYNLGLKWWWIPKH